MNSPSFLSPKAAEQTDQGTAGRMCLLVLGMHRSGTSALTRVLSIAGAELPVSLMGANDSNEVGHWESTALVQYHDQLLSKLGSDWSDWRPIEIRRLPLERRRDIKAEIADLIACEYGEAGLFVVKDPRICRFAPMFLEALDEAAVGAKIVHIVRNPLEVAESLERRDGMARGQAGLLWLCHALESEAASRGKARVVVSYDGLLSDWRGVFARLDQHLGVAWPFAIDEISHEIERFLSLERRHHQHATEDLVLDPMMRKWISEAYSALLVLERNPMSEPALAILDRVRAEFQHAAPVVHRLLEEVRQSAEAERARLRDALAAYERQAVSPPPGSAFGEAETAQPETRDEEAGTPPSVAVDPAPEEPGTAQHETCEEDVCTALPTEVEAVPEQRDAQQVTSGENAGPTPSMDVEPATENSGAAQLEAPGEDVGAPSPVYVDTATEDQGAAQPVTPDEDAAAPPPMDAASLTEDVDAAPLETRDADVSPAPPMDADTVIDDPGAAGLQPSEDEACAAPPMHFFTICARNYLAMAAVLGESLARHHPDSAYTVFVLDPGAIPDSVAHLAIRSIEDAIPANEYAQRRCHYDILELSTCVKAQCFQTLFREGSERVVYLDPDIYVLRPMRELEQELEAGATGVLTPHLLSPLPDDDANPDDLAVLRSGVYNLGFLALKNDPESQTLLAWWDSKLRWKCFRDPSAGVFTDQKWMDFAPLFAPGMHVLRDPSYNVAYWNLAERPLRRLPDGRWAAGDGPLTFFHFSGFDPSKAKVLSKHETRFGDATDELADLLAFYAGRLQAYAHDDVSCIRFTEVAFPCGASWDPVCRVLYRWRVTSGEEELDPLQDPQFASWIAAPGPGQLVPRYIQALLMMRPDVAAAFSVGAGQSLKPLLDWMTSSGKREMGIDPRLLEKLGILPGKKSALPRVTYVGYLRAHLGLGQAARGYVKALTSVGMPVKLVDVSVSSESEVGDYDIVDNYGAGDWDDSCDVHVVHVNADQLPWVLSEHAPRPLKRPCVGVWAWETEEFPDEWLDRFELVDEIWVGSRFMAETIGAKAPVPVQIMPHVVTVPQPRLRRDDLGLADDEFVFLVQFDLLSNMHRKNPEAAIAAFKRAFPGTEKARLIIKTMNADREPAKTQRLKDLADDPRITFWDEALDDNRRHALLAAADCFVSLHRAEGFGLSLAESMAYGKPVIATGWSGNLEFMTGFNSLLVPYDLKPLEFDQGPYRAGTMWAEPDIDEAAKAMRRVWEDRDFAAAVGARAARSVSEQLSPEAIGRKMADRLQCVCANRATEVPSVIARRRRLRWALVRDAAMNPLSYLTKLPAAWRCYRTRGLEEVRFRLAQRLADR